VKEIRAENISTHRNERSQDLGREKKRKEKKSVLKGSIVGVARDGCYESSPSCLIMPLPTTVRASCYNIDIIRGERNRSPVHQAVRMSYIIQHIHHIQSILVQDERWCQWKE